MPFIPHDDPARSFFGFPPPPEPRHPCPGDDDFDEWEKQISGGTGKGTFIGEPPRQKGITLYVVGLLGGGPGYYVDLSTSPSPSKRDMESPGIYLTIKVEYWTWKDLMIGQTVPAILNF